MGDEILNHWEVGIFVQSTINYKESPYYTKQSDGKKYVFFVA